MKVKLGQIVSSVDAFNKVAQQLELPGFGADGQPEDDELLDNDSDEARDFNALQEVG